MNHRHIFYSSTGLNLRNVDQAHILTQTNTIRGRCAACVQVSTNLQRGNSDCTACGAGKYGIATGQTGKASCTVCGEGLLRANKRAKMIELWTDLIAIMINDLNFD